MSFYRQTKGTSRWSWKRGFQRHLCLCCRANDGRVIAPNSAGKASSPKTPRVRKWRPDRIQHTRQAVSHFIYVIYVLWDTKVILSSMQLDPKCTIKYKVKVVSKKTSNLQICPFFLPVYFFPQANTTKFINPWMPLDAASAKACCWSTSNELGLPWPVVNLWASPLNPCDQLIM